MPRSASSDMRCFHIYDRCFPSCLRSCTSAIEKLAHTHVKQHPQRRRRARDQRVGTHVVELREAVLLRHPLRRVALVADRCNAYPDSGIPGVRPDALAGPIAADALCEQASALSFRSGGTVCARQQRTQDLLCSSSGRTCQLRLWRPGS